MCGLQVTQFMSRAAIFSFMPILTKILPESVTNIERGRYYRNRFHEISEKWIREHRQDYRGNRTGDLQVGGRTGGEAQYNSCQQIRKGPPTQLMADLMNTVSLLFV